MSMPDDRIARRHSSLRDDASRTSASGTAPKGSIKPATADELQARRRQAQERFLEIARTLKAEAGVTRHDVCKELGGLAYCDSGVIVAPEGRTRKQLYILAYECAHVALKHGQRRWQKNKPGHVVELEAEQWAHEALRRHGVPVPKAMSRRARNYVGHWIAKDERNGVVVTHEDALRFAGQLTSQRRRALRNLLPPPPVLPFPLSGAAQLLLRIFQRVKK